MPAIRIISEGRTSQRLEFAPGPSLMALLDAAWRPVRRGCRGTGACGLCRVRIDSGEVNPVQLAESLHLEPAQLGAGERLACQVRPNGDVAVAILAPARAFEPRPLRGGPERVPLPSRVHRENAGCGDGLAVAVDLGTTILSLSLCDLRSGARLADCEGSNPQARFGADVVSRLQAATESPDERKALAQMAVAAIGEGLLDMVLRAQVRLAQVRRLAIVGNSAMLALLASSDIDRRLQPGHWDRAGAPLDYDAERWLLGWGIAKQARVDLMAPLGGFVGSDVLAAALAVGLDTEDDPVLLIDFGTNSEIALWDGSRLWVTAAAGGPAFEGSGIGCGWPAEAGAVAHVRESGGGLALEVIGGGEARGFCGTGLIDLIASLLRTGQLTAIGRFTGEVSGRGLCVADAEGTSDAQSLVLTKADIDSFQRAKAAVGVGVRALLDCAELSLGAIGRVWLAGSFGVALDLNNARALGLVPPLPDDRFRFAGHAALAGCEQTLISPAAEARIEALRERTRLVNLGQYRGFDACFMDQLYLRPQAESCVPLRE